MRILKKICWSLLITVLLISVNQTALAGKDKININSATKKELVLLKYVGDKTADKIIEYRKAQPFQKIEDLLKIKGIGQKMLDANKDKIIIKDN